MNALIDQIAKCSVALSEMTIALRFATAVVVFVSTAILFSLRIRGWLRRRRDRR
jgi:hypothetical protein